MPRPGQPPDTTDEDAPACKSNYRGCVPYWDETLDACIECETTVVPDEIANRRAHEARMRVASLERKREGPELSL